MRTTTTMNDLRQQLQQEHDNDKLAYETARKQREAGPCPFDLALLKHEKALQDKMVRSFVQLSAALQALPGNQKTSTKAVTALSSKRPCGTPGNLPLKKRRKRAAAVTEELSTTTTNSEFFGQQCKSLQSSSSKPLEFYKALFCAAQSKAVAEECTSNGVWVPSLFAHIKATQSANHDKPDPPGFEIEDSYDSDDDDDEEEEDSVTTLSCADCGEEESLVEES